MVEGECALLSGAVPEEGGGGEETSEGAGQSPDSSRLQGEDGVTWSSCGESYDPNIAGILHIM